jgi:hypothetical protein
MSEALWHYQDGDRPAGPVSAEVIRAKIRDGHIRRGNLLWKEGMPAWAAVETTEFGADGASVLHSPYAVSTTGMQDDPEPTALRPVSDKPAWIIATAPLWMILLSFLPGTAFIGLAFYVAMAIQDREMFKRAGRQPSNSYWWMILLGAFGAPIYLYLRARRLNGELGYFAASLGSLLLFLVAIVAISIARASG